MSGTIMTLYFDFSYGQSGKYLIIFASEGLHEYF